MGLDRSCGTAVCSVYTEMTDTTAHTHDSRTLLLSLPQRPLRVVIPGGAGHLGRILAEHLHSKGNSVTVLSRSGAVEPWPVVSWNGTDSVTGREGQEAPV